MEPQEIKSMSFTGFKKDYSKQFGLVMMGAGGDLNEWVNGVAADLLEKKLVDVSPVFSEAIKLTENVLGEEGRTDLVLIFRKDAKIEIGRLAMWRLTFGNCSWVDDFVVNYAKDYNG